MKQFLAPRAKYEELIDDVMDIASPDSSYSVIIRK